MRVHNPGVPTIDQKFVCEECSCSFRKLGSLNAHVSKFHAPPGRSGEGDAIGQSAEAKDLLSQALQSTGLTKDPIRNDLASAEDLQGHVVIADRDKDGKVRKHLVKFRLSGDNLRFHLCNYCEKEFKKPSDLCRHLRVHTLERPFKCKLCSRAFAVKSALKVHYRIHMAPNSHVCTTCGKRFTNAAVLAAHRSRHGDQPRQEGSDCSQPFEATIELAEIRPPKPRTKAEVPKNLTSTLPMIEPYVITSDGSVKQAAPRHRSVYQPTRLELLSRPYRCTSCTASFKKSSHLKQHNRRHTGEKPFVCRRCNKSFVTRGTLNSHMKTHDLEPSLYHCNQCTATFTTASSVRRHMASHTETKTFMCPFCQKTFKTSVLCKKHMKVHASRSEDEPPPPIQPLSNIIPPPPQTAPPPAQPELPLAYYTADAAGIITIPLAPQTRRMDGAQNVTGELVSADISKDGAITIKPLESFGIDLMQLTSGNHSSSTTFQLIQIPADGSTGSSDLTDKEFNLLMQPVDPGHSISAPNEPVNRAAPKPSIVKTEQLEVSGRQLLTCSWDECRQTFGTVKELGEHLSVGHQTITVGGNSRNRKKVAKEAEESAEQKFRGPSSDSSSSMVLSEKLLLKSMAEKDRVSAIKGTEEVYKEKFANQCTMCPKSFKKPSDLVRHIRTHTGERPFECEICQKRFTVKSTLDMHKRVHESQPVAIKCHICSVMFASATALKTHMRLHTGAKPFQCPNCDQRFRTSGQRKSHMLSQHPSPATTSQSGLIPLTIPASSMTQALDAVRNSGGPLLGATVRLQLHGSGLDNAVAQLQVDENLLQQLQNGENIHIVLNPMDAATGPAPSGTSLEASSSSVNLPPADAAAADLDHDEVGDSTDKSVEGQNKVFNQVFICPWCDTDLSSETERFSHLLNIHGIQIKESDDVKVEEEMDDEDDDEEVMGLDEVSASSGKNDGLLNSDRTCRHCGKVFNKPSQLSRHLRVHTGEKPFACVLCLKAFNQKNSLQIHMKKHTGERPFVCPFCSYAFTQKGNLKTHIQRSHAELAQQIIQMSQQKSE